MPEKLLTEMNFDEMAELMDSFIERSSEQGDEMSTGSFFTLLSANLAQRAKKTVEIEGRVINGQLVLIPPRKVSSELTVQNNQIVVGDQRITVKLAS